MRLSQELEQSVFVLSEDELLSILSEDVIHGMRIGEFNPERVEEAMVSILVPYGLTEDDEFLVNEAIDEFGESMGLEEGFMDWLKSAAKKALKAVGTAALDAAKEGGHEAIATTAKELQKRLAAKKKQDKDENKKGTQVDSDEEPKKEPKKKVRRKPKKEPEEDSEKETEREQKGKEPSKSKSKSKPKSKPEKSKSKRVKPEKEKQTKEKPEKKKPEPDDDEDEDSDDIKKNLKNIAGKALGKIADDPEKIKDILKKSGKKAVKAVAKHGVKKGMKMVFGRWIKTKDKGGSKKEAIEWLAANAEVYPLSEDLIVYDLEEKVPDWIAEAFCGECRENVDGRRYEFVPGEVSRFMMLEKDFALKSPSEFGFKAYKPGSGRYVLRDLDESDILSSEIVKTLRRLKRDIPGVATVRQTDRGRNHKKADRFVEIGFKDKKKHVRFFMRRYEAFLSGSHSDEEKLMVRDNFTAKDVYKWVLSYFKKYYE